MIENDTQLAVTKERLKEMEDSLKPAHFEYLIAKAHYESLLSMRDELLFQVSIYEGWAVPGDVLSRLYNWNGSENGGEK